MKVSIVLLFAAIVLGGGFTYNEMQQNNLLTQQIDDYVRQNSQLLTQIENNSLKNSESAKTLHSLQDELKNRESQLAALSRQLETAQQQIDPDYQRIEFRIRQQLTNEIQASNNTPNLDPRIALLKQLSQLDPMVMGEIMALNAQYGEYIKGLNVSEEREEVIINALHNMIADQNQAREQLMQEMLTDPQSTGRDDLHRLMEATSSPEAQLNALSYDLTEAELNAFSEFQEEQQDIFSSFEIFGGPVNGPIFLGDDVVQFGSGQSGAIQILPINPSN
jgi:hypothetical protein